VEVLRWVGVMIFFSVEFLFYLFGVSSALHVYYRFSELGVIAIFLSNLLNCVDFGVIISLVEESVDHGT
jgi:hypothetical protein